MDISVNEKWALVLAGRRNVNLQARTWEDITTWDIST